MRRIIVLLGLSFFSFGGYSQQELRSDSTDVEQLDAVLIEAVRVEADSPITHTNVSKEEIAKRNLGQDIPILLNYLPNVVTASDAGAGVGYTYIRVRGSDASRVNVTLNGIPFNDAESQGTFWVNLPDFASSVESLQVQRGVGTSTNGSGSFGASINILTDALSREAYAELTNSFGSFNTRKHNLKFSTGLIDQRFEFSGRLSNIVSDGYIDRATSDLKSYFLQGVYTEGNTLIKALTFGGREETYQAYFGIDAETLENDRTFNPAGIYTDDEGNIRFYDNEVDNYAQDHYQLFWNQRYNNYWSSNVAVNYTYGRGYFEQFVEDGDMAFHEIQPLTINGEFITTTDLVRRRWLDNDFYAINADVNYKDGTWDVDAGAFFSYYDGDHFGEVIWARFANNADIRDRYYFGVGEKSEFTIFGKATLRLNEQWVVFADLQGRFIDYQTRGLSSFKEPLEVSQQYNFFNPKAGLTYKFSDVHQFYASYGRANREPRRSDFEQGITTPETLDDFELGWRFNQNGLGINANAYYMNYTNQLVLTGAIDDVGAPIRATSGKSYRLGLEIDATVPLTRKLILRPNIALSSNKNVDFVRSLDGNLVNLGNTNISFSPSVVAGNSISYSLLDNLQLDLLSKYVGEQYMGNIDSEASKLAAFFVNDINIVYRIDELPLAESITFSALLNNIFNVEYVSNGYFFTFDDDFTNPGTVTTVEGAGYYPQATFNFLLGAAIRF